MALGSAATLFVSAGEAFARGERISPSRRVTAKPVAKVVPPEGPLLAVVSLARQRITVYGKDGLLAQSVVSTGQPGFRTPTGMFSVLQKNRHHRSNIYSGAPMPFMQRLTWSGIALHAGVVPGYPASHGCIRLTPTFAAQLWGMTKMGARVVVAPEEATAVAIEHARLPVPTMTPVGADAASTKTVLASLAPNKGGDAPAADARLSPLDRAKLAKAFAHTDAAAKAKAAKLAVDASTRQAAEANKAIAALRQAGLAVAAARGKLDAATRAVEAAKTPEAVERAKAAAAAADTTLQQATTAAEEAAALEAKLTAEALAAARATWEADSASKAATEMKAALEKSTEPISIFISRKAGRIYIRQGWQPIHEAPAVFKDAEAQLGTHLYLATEPVGQGKGMRWLSVSLQPETHRQDARRARRNDRSERDDPPPRPAAPGLSATATLDNIELPEETQKFISDRLWAGAALTISDQGISNETGKFTDFIVLTR